jgi:phosphatidylglycerophosphate synthase
VKGGNMADSLPFSAASIGNSDIPVWGMANRERTRRIAAAAGHTLTPDPAQARMLAHDGFVFDPLWYRHLATLPGHVLTKDGVPALSHVTDARQAQVVADAMSSDAPLAVTDGLTLIAIEDGAAIENKELRKTLTPFVDRLTRANVPMLERASYFGAYKGVTDILTLYLWPEWALVLTRICARIGMSPNQVTAIGFALCLLATWLFWIGEFGWGMLAGLIFMVLDTVDGKLARCTITSSWWGNVFDHGIDLVHPPFWWAAWAVGLSVWGLGLSNSAMAWVLGGIIMGYVVQRLIEGAFIARNGGMHIHVWEKIDSQFRLITARRNPNMVILFVCWLARRPDIGLIAVAWWTVLSCLFHLVRLVQAEWVRSRGKQIRSWMEDPQ